MFFACTDNKAETTDAHIESAEEAYSYGRMARAQSLCDSLFFGDEFGRLGIWELCRLSLLFMRLGEDSGEPEANTAFAARCLKAAVTRDSDSTMIYVKAMPVEDRARLLLLHSLNEASHSAPEEDTITIEEIVNL